MSVTKAYFNIVDETLFPETTLVLIGTAKDGPTGVPFSINGGVQGFQVLGDSPLEKAYVCAANAGANNIVLYRLNGKHSSLKITYTDDDGTVDVLQLVSVSANVIYDDIKIRLGPDSLTVVNTNGSTREYFFHQYPSAVLMAEAINTDSLYGLVEFTAIPLSADFEMNKYDIDHMMDLQFDGGDTEENLIPARDTTADISTTIVELKSRLKSALFGLDPEDQILRDPNSNLGVLDFGVLCLVDLFHEDDSELVNILGGFCSNKMYGGGRGCISVIGTQPLYEITEAKITEKFTSLMAKSPTKVSTGGASLEIVTGDVELDPLCNVQIINGDTILTSVYGEDAKPISLAYAYAGAQAAQPYYNTMTNKTLSGILQVTYEFIKEDIDKLSSNGYISIVASIRKGFVPYFCVGAVGKSHRSAYKSPSSVRISQYIVKKITAYLDSFIGTNVSPVIKSGLENGVRDILRTLVGEEVIRKFELNFNYLNRNSEIKIDVQFTPYSDVSAVTSVVRMPFNQGVIG